MAPTLFHGTPDERAELLAALDRNCECKYAPVTNVRTYRCPGHASFSDSQSYVDHLEFARTLRDQLDLGEWTTLPTQRPGGKL